MHGEQGANPRFIVTNLPGAAILRNTRRARVLLASAHPMKHVFLTAARALSP